MRARSSEVVSLPIKWVHLHVDVTVLVVAHPADGCAVEGRPGADVTLEHWHRLGLLDGLQLWWLEGQQLGTFFKASER